MISENVFSGANYNPANTPALNNRHWHTSTSTDFWGFSTFITARSSMTPQYGDGTLAGDPFVTYFNLGNGMFFKEDGVTIDIERTCSMADSFISQGFTYFDTAYGYHNGESEVAVGEALKGIYPVLDDGALATLKKTITDVVYQRGDDFTVQYDRYIAAGSGAALSIKHI